jgi:hypothetical protein
MGPGSVQSGPLKNLDVLAVQVETLRDQRAQFARAAGAVQWLPQFDHSAPLTGIGLERNRISGGHEVCVIPGGHGLKTSGGLDLRP